MVEQLVHNGAFVHEVAVYGYIGQGDIGGVFHRAAGHAHAHVTHARPAIWAEELLVFAQNRLQMHEGGRDVGVNVRGGVYGDGNLPIHAVKRVGMAKVVAHRHGYQISRNGQVELPIPYACAVGEGGGVRQQSVADGSFAVLGADMEIVGRFVGELVHAGKPATTVSVRLVVKRNAHVISVFAVEVEAPEGDVMRRNAVVKDAHLCGVAALHRRHINEDVLPDMREVGRLLIHLHRIGGQPHQIQPELVEVVHFCDHGKFRTTLHHMVGEVHHGKGEVIMCDMHGVCALLREAEAAEQG